MYRSLGLANDYVAHHFMGSAIPFPDESSQLEVFERLHIHITFIDFSVNFHTRKGRLIEYEFLK